MNSSPLIVLERVLEIHQALTKANIEHAIGGALALAYHTEYPRPTQDIDLNISLPANQANRVFQALPATIPWSENEVAETESEEQIRLNWPVPGSKIPIPVDLFFAAHEFHLTVAARCLSVPMLGEMIPILNATDISIFKLLFNRSKDWADIEEVISANPPTFDPIEVQKWLTKILGKNNSIVPRFSALLAAQPNFEPSSKQIFKSSKLN